MWLYVPFMESHSALAVEDSTSDLISQSQDIELFVTLSGKPTQRPFSWRGWLKRPYHKLLSGIRLSPSTASRGVESFISSLRATPASPGHTPDSAKDTTTSGSCLMTLPELSARWNPSLYSLKTLPEQLIFDTTVKPSSKAWATELRRDYSQRLKWAQARNGNGVSFWHTPLAIYGEHPGMEDESHLTGQAISLSLRLDEMKSTPGLKSSRSTRVLNPRFEEMLMGFPIGWSDCKPLVTPWSRLLPRWRSQLYTSD